MHNIINELEQLNFNYTKYNQEDAFETLNNILNSLRYPQEIQRYMNYLFLFKSKKICHCMERPILEDTMFPQLFQICSDCH